MSAVTEAQIRGLFDRITGQLIELRGWDLDDDQWHQIRDLEAEAADLIAAAEGMGVTL